MTLTTEYTTKDSGERQDFATGSRRDTQDGKPRYDLIGQELLDRLAALMERGAVKYGEDNWRLGQPASRYIASGLRHLFQWKNGERDEDHLAAVVFNIGGLMQLQEQCGYELPEELLDHKAMKPELERIGLEDRVKDALIGQFVGAKSHTRSYEIDQGLSAAALFRHLFLYMPVGMFREQFEEFLDRMVQRRQIKYLPEHGLYFIHC